MKNLDILDMIYDEVDDLLLAGEFEKVDNLLSSTNPNDYLVDILLALLTITLSASNKLPSRSRFVIDTENSLKCRGIYRDSLLDGLR